MDERMICMGERTGYECKEEGKGRPKMQKKYTYIVTSIYNTIWIMH